jgi:hypothetical protein
LVHDLGEAAPELLGAGFGFGGDGEDFGDAVGFSEGFEALGEDVVADAVGLGADDEIGALHGLEELDELGVGGLRGDVSVYEADAEGEGFAFGEVGLDELGPLGGDGFGDFGVTVAGEVGEDHGRTHLFLFASAFMQGEEVDGAGAAGGRGGVGLFGAEEGVDEGTFADVGAAKEGDFGGVEGFGFGGEVGGVGGREHEGGGEAHELSVSG